MAAETLAFLRSQKGNSRIAICAAKTEIGATIAACNSAVIPGGALEHQVVSPTRIEEPDGDSEPKLINLDQWTIDKETGKCVPFARLHGGVPSVAWGKSGEGTWQMQCPVCGPVCSSQLHSSIEDNKKEGDAAVLRGDWSLARYYYYECIGYLKKDTSPRIVSAVHANASLVQLKEGSPRSALRHADLAIKAREDWAKGHARRGAALEKLGELQGAYTAYSRAASLEPNTRDYVQAVNRLHHIDELITDGASP